MDPALVAPAIVVASGVARIKPEFLATSRNSQTLSAVGASQVPELTLGSEPEVKKLKISVEEEHDGEQKEEEAKTPQPESKRSKKRGKSCKIRNFLHLH